MSPARRRRISNTIGIDDAPFDRSHRGDVGIVGVVFTRTRLDGVMTGKLRRDGANASRAIVAMVAGSPFAAHAQALLLGGITFAGFNVVDIHAVHAALGLPVLVVARRRPDYPAIEAALTTRVPGGRRKLALLAKAGPMEPCAGVWVQRAGLELDAAAELLADLTVYGKLPEPIRVAHLVAGGLGSGSSRGRA